MTSETPVNGSPLLLLGVPCVVPWVLPSTLPVVGWVGGGVVSPAVPPVPVVLVGVLGLGGVVGVVGVVLGGGYGGTVTGPYWPWLAEFGPRSITLDWSRCTRARFEVWDENA
jgi:hypothetical protein